MEDSSFPTPTLVSPVTTWSPRSSTPRPSASQCSYISDNANPIADQFRYIFAGHVAEYMETLADDDEERYKSQFQKYIDEGIEGKL